MCRATVSKAQRREEAVILDARCHVDYAEAGRRPFRLKGIAMTSSVPRESEERRIIPLRPRSETPSTPPPEANTQPSPCDREDAARHYLKFMLPSIPVATFILTFILCYVLRGMPAGAITLASKRAPVIVDPRLPFLGALLLGVITGILCMWIYFGYLRVSGAESHHHTEHPLPVAAGSGLGDRN